MSALASLNARTVSLPATRRSWIRAVGFGLLLGVCSPWTAAPSHAAPPLRITLDPGHGGSQIGSSYRFADGVVLQEKALSLRVGLRLRQLLEQAGFSVTLTRSTDAPVNVEGRDLNGDGRVGLADELQARVDLANRAGSDLFVSICFNGSSDPSAKGTEIFWNPNRPFSDRNQRLAELTQAHMVSDLTAAGYAPQDRGTRTDAALLGGDALFLLGPASSTIARPSQMPSIVGETLFLTNPADATALRDDRILEAIARGYFDGVQAYFSSSVRAVTSRAAVTTVLSAASAPSARAAPSAPAAPSQPRWTVYVIAYQDTPAGQRLAERAVRSLSASGILASARVATRAGSNPPSSYVVVASGRFDTRQAALARSAEVRQAGYTEAYVSSVAS